MINLENKPFRGGQPGVAMPVEIRQRISEAYHRKSSEEQAKQIVGLLALTPEQLEIRRKNIDQTGKPKTDEYLRKRSTVWNTIKPLVLRDATIPEMISITDLTRDQIANAVHHSDSPERSDILREYLSPEKEKERRKKSREAFLNKKPLSQEQENSDNFATNLLNESLILEDTIYWNKLREIYKTAGRDLPESISDQLRLEVLLRARLDCANGDLDLLLRYSQLRDSIDPRWFDVNLREEEKFVIDSLEISGINSSTPDCVHHWMLGDPMDGVVFGDCIRCGGHKEFSNKNPEHRVANGKAQISLGYGGKARKLD